VEHTRRALGRVLWDLADLGYDAQWIGIRASDAGAPHGRFRVWITAQPAAYARGGRREDGQAPQEGQPVIGDGGAGGVKLLPTPTAGDGKSSGSRNLEGSKAHAGVSLTDAVVHGDSTTGRATPVERSVDFGVYAPAVARWEAVLGRPAPSPTVPGREGRPRLNPVFVEWMMGLPQGHVTAPEIGLSRADILKALGNGVVPIQAAVAISHMTFGTPIAPQSAVTTWRTPTAQLAVNGGSQHPDKRKAGGHGPTLADEIEHLLPTPAVNDMGEGKTVEDWDAWTERMKAEHRNGNGHGKSLSIEAQRLASTHARTEGDDMTNPLDPYANVAAQDAPERDLIAELEDCIGEIPSEVADLLNSALNDDIELSNAALRAWLHEFLLVQDGAR
jgi:hypothetical protein